MKCLVSKSHGSEVCNYRVQRVFFLSLDRITIPASPLTIAASLRKKKTLWHPGYKIRDVCMNFEPYFKVHNLVNVHLVQSLNSPFFPPHIGAEPGRAKEEDNLHAHAQNEPNKNHQKLLGPNHAARVNVSRNTFFSSRSEKKNHFL